jgi:hypothetical protein
MRNLQLVVLFSLVAFLLAACAPEAEPAATAAAPGDGEGAAGAESTATALAATATASPATATAAPQAATATPEPSPTAAATGALAEQGRAALAQRLGVEPGAVSFVGAEEATWPSTALGCPLPGFDYEERAVTGTRVILVLAGEEYNFNVAGERATLCDAAGQPVLPTLPADPDAIDDGSPWIPVDPLPAD